MRSTQALAALILLFTCVWTAAEVSRGTAAHKGFSVLLDSPGPEPAAEPKATTPTRAHTQLVQRVIHADTHYDVLGVSTDATDGDVQNAYRGLKELITSPPGLSDKTTIAAAFIIIEARDVLTNKTARTEYDASLAAETSTSPVVDDEEFSQYREKVAVITAVACIIIAFVATRRAIGPGTVPSIANDGQRPRRHGPLLRPPVASRFSRFVHRAWASGLIRNWLLASAVVFSIERLIGHPDFARSDFARHSTLVTIFSSLAAFVWRIVYIDDIGPSGLTWISFAVHLFSSVIGIGIFWRNLAPPYFWYASRIGLAFQAYQSWRYRYWLPFVVTIPLFVPFFIIGSMDPAKFL